MKLSKNSTAFSSVGNSIPVISDYSFSTSDTLLASWLALNLIEPEKIAINPQTNQASFCYNHSANQQEQQQFISQFNAGQAVGNIVMYHRIYRKLIRDITSAKENQL